MKAVDALPSLCRDTKKWGLYLRAIVEQEARAAWIAYLSPLIGQFEATDLVCDGHLFLLFVEEAECWSMFDRLEHDGAEMPVYAEMCDPSGEGVTENT